MSSQSTKSSARRTPIHTRNISSLGYLREDELWDIETTLTDNKHYPFKTIERGELSTNEFVHRMTMVVTLNDELVIQDIKITMADAPFRLCQAVIPRFDSLVGVQIKSGWRDKVKALLKGRKGCTHLVELLSVVATTAFQTVLPYRNRNTLGAKLIHSSIVDQCQGFAADGEVIREHFPQFYKPSDEE
ncbi:DUF2889 domain-containing protein [Pleionea litopenaei]|uniref:DUF2889 domain-containing protein n=1 Tax=Pleionea litopenaei TaxID=3070815 RepID=A0AA51X7C8_9GAMM|nr:DUF2889 domain-containing protein [Pleionea sp. HL-JVS1]WMS87746.1 DUF2889 domain-containing protein [Pleionea sp. HL-JVS1]